MGSILRHRSPPFGDDTFFVSMRAFLDTLTAVLPRATLSAPKPKTAKLPKPAAYKIPRPPPKMLRHPVVIIHLLSDRRGLYVNPVFTTHIVDLTASAALLAMLCTHCQQPEFQAKVRCQSGDITIWDNHATWHKAIND